MAGTDVAASTVATTNKTSKLKKVTGVLTALGLTAAGALGV